MDNFEEAEELTAEEKKVYNFFMEMLKTNNSRLTDQEQKQGVKNADNKI